MDSADNATSAGRLGRGIRFGLWPALSLIGLLIGVAAPPGGLAGSGGGWWSIRALGRIALISITAITLLVGPGLGVRLLLGGHRTLDGRADDLRRAMPLAVAIWFGPGLVAVLGGLAWVLAPGTDPYLTVRIGAAVLLLALLVGCCFLKRPVLDRDECWLGGLGLLVFLIGLGRSLWSVSPSGELYHNTISRTIEIGDRPDSRISYFTVSLIGHGNHPFAAVGHLLFYPYSFSDRGPLPGIISAPMVLLAGAVPANRFPVQQWTPFDQQGFMIYRIVMMLLAISILPAGYQLAKRLAGRNAGRLAALLLAGTPFVLHDVYYTWPKLAAAALCLLAGYLVLIRQPILAGLAVGIGYLMHPLALLTVPTLLLLEVLAARPAGKRWPSLPRLAGWIVGSMAGLAVVLVSWRVAQGRYYSQSRFLIYLKMANNARHPSASAWLDTRLASIGNTLVPLRLPILDGNLRAINAVGPRNTRLRSGTLVHFFFQYWNTLPFGVGIVFFPVLLIALYQFARRNPLGFLVGVIVPFVVFAVYWGSFISGLLREGMHPWVATLLVLAAIPLAGWRRFRWLLAGCLLGRLVEALAMLTVTSVASQHELIDHRWADTDLVALALLLVGLLGLAALTLAELKLLPTRPGRAEPATSNEPERAGRAEPATSD